MFTAYFTEMPFNAYPEDEVRTSHPEDHPAQLPNHTAVLFSNRFFDPVEATRLYAERFEEYQYADEVGFDGLMTNEHHNFPFCMQTRINVISAVLAATTKRAKILQMGNPLPIWDNPVTLAEEIAMIDMISGGRVIAGILRGIGYEQIATNTNPAYNRERFIEAHDLMVKTWSEPGPFRWEGEHYQFRVVNPWALPLQTPHPPIWIPGIASAETIQFAARHAYPYICLSTTPDQTRQIYGLYEKEAREVGYEMGTEHRGYMIRCHVAETEEKALQNAREFTWMTQDIVGPWHPVFWTPSGYSSREAVKVTRGKAALFRSTFEEQIKQGLLIAGTPDQVIDKIRWWLEEFRPGILPIHANDGHVNHEDSMTCIRLFGEEVIPALREIAEQLDLKSPFEMNAPVGLAAEPA